MTAAWIGVAPAILTMALFLTALVAINVAAMQREDVRAQRDISRGRRLSPAITDLETRRVPEPPFDGSGDPREHGPMSNQREPDGEARPVVRRVVSAIDDALHGAVDTIEGVAGAALDATTRRWERPGARVRAVRRRGRQPLPMLYEDHPEARRATPRELGIRTIDVADIEGTAVGGARQRGGDFLPLKPFRSQNWRGRWQRLRSAADRLVVLPSIDVVRFADRYWVVDGHNRVASALYGGQLTIDANVTDLRLPGQSKSEPPASLAAQVDDSRDLRAAVSRTSTKPERPPADEEAAGPAEER